MPTRDDAHWVASSGNTALASSKLSGRKIAGITGFLDITPTWSSEPVIVSDDVSTVGSTATASIASNTFTRDCAVNDSINGSDTSATEACETPALLRANLISFKAISEARPFEMITKIFDEIEEIRVGTTGGGAGVGVDDGGGGGGMFVDFGLDSSAKLSPPNDMVVLPPGGAFLRVVDLLTFISTLVSVDDIVPIY